jgi:sortase A
MAKYQKAILQYLILPVLLVIVSVGILAVGAGSISNFLQGQLRNAIIRGTPEFSYNLQQNILNGETQASGESLEQQTEVQQTKQVELPSYGMQYGMLSCDRIQLQSPVYYGDTDELLEKGAGQYINSVFPGQEGYTLIGAHDVSYFAPLENIQTGDTIIFSTTYGEYQYEVTQTAVLDTMEDEKIYEKDSNGEELILYTCYPFGDFWEERNERLFVYCRQVSGQAVTEES